MAITSTRRLHELLGAGARQIRSVVPRSVHYDLGKGLRDLAAVIRKDRRVLEESASFAEARARWVAAVNMPVLDRTHLDRSANALALRYAAGIAAMSSVLMRERTDELTRRIAFIDHQTAEIERLKDDLDTVAHERDLLFINRAASTAWEQPRNPDGTFGSGDGGGGGGGEEGEGALGGALGGGEGGGGKGGPAAGGSPDAMAPTDAASQLTRWATSAAFARAVRKSIAAGRPSVDAVGILQAITESPRTTAPVYRAIDPSLMSIFSPRENVDINLTSFTRDAPGNAVLMLRVLPGAHVADPAPFSPFDEGEVLVAGRFQVLDSSPTEVVLRQVGRFEPGTAWPARSAALQEFDIRDAVFRPELDAVGSFAMDRA